ncbi:MAG: antitoxin family protein, partial [Planctomycetes bacterium]|nr:antitoxin family protein [Planctomycetota bacterium]
MTRTVLARYDGQVIVPDEALELPAGQRLRIEIQTVEADSPPFADL